MLAISQAPCQVSPLTKTIHALLVYHNIATVCLHITQEEQNSPEASL